MCCMRRDERVLNESDRNAKSAESWLLLILIKCNIDSKQARLHGIHVATCEPHESLDTTRRPDGPRAGDDALREVDIDERGPRRARGRRDIKL